MRNDSRPLFFHAHTLLDNGLKYSQSKGKVEVFLSDEDDGVLVSVESYGPLLLEGEHEKIFQPFYRGANAIQVAEEGSGYGLYVSQMVAVSHLGTRISVEQNVSRHDWRGYFTAFSIKFPTKARVLF